LMSSISNLLENYIDLLIIVFATLLTCTFFHVLAVQYPSMYHAHIVLDVLIPQVVKL
ncbi:hypothetical protein ACJX0J_040307, partial [Zea mays]